MRPRDFLKPKLLAILGLIAAIALVLGWRWLGSSPNVTSAAPPPGDRPVSSLVSTDSDSQSPTNPGEFADRLRSALSIADFEARLKAVSRLVELWLKVDPSGLIKFWDALEVRQESDALGVLAMALRDALTRIDASMAGSDPILLLVQRLVSHLAGTDPRAALSWARQWLADDARESSLVSVARGMARSDIAASLEVAASILSPLRRSQAYAAVATIWASRDSAAAVAWAAGLTNPSERAQSLNATLLVAARQNPAEAAKTLSLQAAALEADYSQRRTEELAKLGVDEAELANDPESFREMVAAGNITPPTSPDSELMAASGKVIGARLAAAGIPEAMAWADSLASNYLRLTSLSGVVEGWARLDPVAALDFVDLHHSANSDMHTSVYQAWASTDPRAAAEAATRIDDGPFRGSILGMVFKTWAAAGQIDDATAYFRQLPPSPSSDSAGYSLATALSFDHPESAWDIARTIGDETLQMRALRAAYSTLLVRDPDRARALLQNAKLPAASTQRLAQMLGAVVGPQ